MHAAPTLKHWMHHFHDSGVRAIRYAGHLMHEKSFWGMLGILVLIAGLLTLIVFFGRTTTVQSYGVPTPYRPYF
jgi:hypothetical protein